jgi:hypothetical protein
MKQFTTGRTWFICLFAGLLAASIPVYSNDKKPAQEFYQIEIYHFKTTGQEKIIDDYLQHALIPALHKKNIINIGVFKPIANDTAADKLVYVFVPLKSFEALLSLPAQLDKDADYNAAAAAYLQAVYTDPPYTRMESILLQAFPLAPQMQVPGLKAPHNERIYELRSYESPTEKYHVSKVHMFNEGGEIPLFKRLEFNAVFYADVINGSHMPNLMYMTSFENMAEREAHWKAFFADDAWKKLVVLPEYQHNVSKAEIFLLHATDYSEL